MVACVKGCRYECCRLGAQLHLHDESMCSIKMVQELKENDCVQLGEAQLGAQRRGAYSCTIDGLGGPRGCVVMARQH
jgi:hypothetical protein